jgi:hypothetical protein
MVKTTFYFKIPKKSIEVPITNNWNKNQKNRNYTNLK